MEFQMASESDIQRFVEQEVQRRTRASLIRERGGSIPELTAYDRNRLLNRGLIPGTQAWAIGAMDVAGNDEQKKIAKSVEEGGKYKKMGLPGQTLTKNLNLLDAVAALGGDTGTIARSLAAALSPRSAVGGAR